MSDKDYKLLEEEREEEGKEFKQPYIISDEDDDNQDEYGNDSFIAGSDEDLDDSFDDDKPLKKRRKKRKKKELESEDEEIIRQYEDIQKGGKRRLKKIKREERKVDDFIEEDILERKKKRKDVVYRHVEREDREKEEESGDDADKFDEDVQLKNIFGPQDLAQHYETDLDREIVRRDLPERLQIRFKNRPNPKNEEIVFETTWIVTKIIKKNGLYKNDMPSLEKKVLKILEFIRISFYEIMFIWKYKRHEIMTKEVGEEVGYELKLTDFWYIYQLDLEWDKLFSKKKSVEKMVALLKTKIEVSKRVEEMLAGSFDKLVINYIYDYAEYNIKKYFDDDEYYNLLEKKSTLKKFKKRNFSREIIKYGLNSVADSISLTANQFADNIVEEKQVHQPPVLTEKPDIKANKIVRKDISYLSTPVETVSQICEYVAREYFYHPLVCQFLRKLYDERVLISTEPKGKGKELKVYDYYYPTKRIHQKQPSNISKELWLLMLESEKKGLIQIKFNFGEDEKQKRKDIIYKLRMFLLLKPRDHIDTKTLDGMWDLVREEIISKLLSNYMIPVFERQMRQELTEISENFLIGLCADDLKYLINMKPYKDTGEVKVLSCNSDLNDQACFCIINEDGYLDDYIFLNNIMRKPRDFDHSQKILYQSAIKELEIFIKKHMPQVIVVAPKNIRSQSLKIELNTIREHIYEESSMEKPFVMWGNLKVARIFAKSEVSLKRMKEYSELVKETVSMARYLQNPLAETLNLWNEELDKNFLLFISFQPLQSNLNKKLLKDKFETVILEIINKKGVDLDSCVRHPHLSNQLQFVCGLGPRKANKIIENIRLNRTQIEKRSDLYEAYMKKTVYDNAIGFLIIDGRVNPKTFQHNRKVFNWLDFTRIHPDNYGIPTQIAKDLFDGETLQENQLVRKIFQNDSLLDTLDLVDYGKFLSDKYKCNMQLLIDQIVEEFKRPFQDNRPKFDTKFNKEEIFYYLSNENIFSFKEESIVSLKIMKIDDRCLKVITDNGLMGLINAEDINDDSYDVSAAKLKQLFPIGSYVKGKVKSISFETIKAKFSLKNEDLENHKEFLRKNKILNKFSLNEGFDFIIKKEDDFPILNIEGKRKIGRFTPRRINHPHFRNIGLGMTQEYLSDRLNGDFIFRPSSKGTGYLNLTWKIYNNIIAHIPIKEGYKRPKDDISGSLTIHKTKFETLDHIIESFIKPCNNYIKSVVEEKKFVGLGINHINKTLIEEKKENKAKIPYYYSFVKEYSQFVILSYILKDLSVKHELIKIKPDGFYFHENCFSSLSHVTKYFKEKLKTSEYQNYLKKVPRIMLGDQKEKEHKSRGRDRDRHRKRGRDDSDSSYERYKSKREGRYGKSYNRGEDRYDRERRRNRSRSNSRERRSRKSYNDHDYNQGHSYNYNQGRRQNEDRNKKTENNYDIQFETAN